MAFNKSAAAMHVERADDSTTKPEVSMASYEQEPEAYSVGALTVLAVFALSLANCCATLSNTTNTIIRYQVMAVGGVSEAPWIANASFLLTLACAPIFGSLADRFGKKWIIVGACGLGVAGSFTSSSASKVGTLIGGNSLVGIANAGCIVSIAANQEIIPNKYRPYAFGFAQTVNSIAAIAGTFLAGTFAEYATWSWSYRFNGICYAVSGLSVLLTYRPPPTALRRSTPISQLIREFDYAGTLLLAGSLACVVVALTWGGSNYAWKSSMIIGLLVGGCAGLVVFGVFEWKVKKAGALLDHRLFHSFNFPVLCFICMIDGMLLLGINVAYSQEIPDLFGGDAIRIATILSPYLITSTLGCLPAGWLMGKTRGYRLLLASALLWTSLFTGLMAFVNPDRLNYALAFSALFGIGTAVTTVIPIVALGLSVPSFLLGTAGTLSISSRALGGIVGITIYTAIYNAKYASYLPQHIATALSSLSDSGKVTGEILQALATGMPTPVALATVKDLPPQMIPVVLGAIASASSESWKFVWIAIAIIILGGAASCLLLKSVREDMTEHVESALEKSETRNQQMKMKNDVLAA